MAALSTGALGATQQKIRKPEISGSAGNMCPSGVQSYKPHIGTASDALSIEELEKQSARGEADAMIALGLRYMLANEGQNTDVRPSPDPTKALELFKAAAEKGDGYAEFLVGVAYIKGDGVERSDAEALAWFIRAAKHKIVPAQFWVGEMTAKGRGVAADWKAALPYFKHAAEGGWELAYVELGYAYENGYGVKQDYQKAAFCFRQQRTLQVAQYNLRQLIKQGYVKWQDNDPMQWRGIGPGSALDPSKKQLPE